MYIHQGWPSGLGTKLIIWFRQVQFLHLGPAPLAQRIEQQPSKLSVTRSSRVGGVFSIR